MKFRPDRKQMALKLRIHRVVSPIVLSRINTASLGMLHPYLGDVDVARFSAWCNNPDFVEYLLSPDEVELDLYEAREDAKNMVIDVVRGNFTDSKKAAVQLKAAEMLLNRE